MHLIYEDSKHPSEKRLLRFALALALLVATCIPRMAQATEAATELAVLDVELTGDLGGPEFTAQHETRLKMASTRLREKLERAGTYRVIDLSRAGTSVDRLNSQHRFLHSCGECVLQIGRELGAERIVATWVYRVSNLILTLNYELSDVASGQITRRKSFDFRGDNDQAWTHAIDYMVRDMTEEGAVSSSDR